MISSLTRLGRMVLWLLISVLVVLALLVTLLRVLLPEMNRFKDEIQHWVSDGTQIQWVVSDVRGFWRNTHPSLSLEGVQANLPDGSQIQFQAQRVDVEFDLLQSLLQRQPVVANLIIHQLNLDIRSIDWLALQQAESNPSFNSQGVILQRI
ncbi:hypothetical protein CAG53_00445, partial [Vibrio sp. V26_P1S5P106]|uniref:YhdP family protein n=3 Tax=Vibrionaceae TaxID=641 RepID=UPI001392BFD8|nr:hypothetical protein [Vibrio sp. V26_P1S5P106]